MICSNCPGDICSVQLLRLGPAPAEESRTFKGPRRQHRRGPAGGPVVLDQAIDTTPWRAGSSCTRRRPGQKGAMRRLSSRSAPAGVASAVCRGDLLGSLLWDLHGILTRGSWYPHVTARHYYEVFVARGLRNSPTKRICLWSRTWRPDASSRLLAGRLLRRCRRR
jgi:hypothetical protein